ncbi:MAG: Carboxylesterase (EC [uncultured Paraburkholderia sp.]|uniref:alpha/beta hydrolase n=1 Tax=uncultured Paraburkholderia sp. TaxID=1822466 RepID=UPI002597B4C8|nr:alpha/beta fold hydrolase [uncultured Paraburkholderia sp.]CAH2897159.1 MAG: Carboxylesterase (EC [uncultured Paraburkholderia sp.]CAH2921061.1 MAG: Carboxylesterase (EC [uncultured Paraburkholderia sp.]
MNPTQFPAAPGNDHVVLILHGLSSSPAELRFLSRALVEEGFATHTPELRGYSAGTGHVPMEQWISAAVAEFDALAARHRHVSVCGLSMGATLAAAVAQERPSARALILLSITLSYDGWAIPWYRFLLDYAYYTSLRSRYRYREHAPYGLRNEALRSKIARVMQRDGISEVGPASIAIEASRLAKSVRRKLKSISTDCLIIHAIDDETSSPHNARYVVANVGASFLRTIWLDDSYHMITSDNEREVVARECAVFLRESAAASASCNNPAPVISRALARRLRQLAAVARKA